MVDYHRLLVSVVPEPLVLGEHDPTFAARTLEPLDVRHAFGPASEDLDLRPDDETMRSKNLDDGSAETEVDVELKRRVGARH